MEKHQFKPFDQVLVRNSDNQPWHTNLYAKLDANENHKCLYGTWRYCIPYNEETAHLLGTTKPYEQPQPKTFSVSWATLTGQYTVEYTDKEFENFIKTAVLHNKDVSNFNVRKICG